jgi:hypothetical protein
MFQADLAWYVLEQGINIYYIINFKKSLIYKSLIILLDIGLEIF